MLPFDTSQSHSVVLCLIFPRSICLRILSPAFRILQPFHLFDHFWHFLNLEVPLSITYNETIRRSLEIFKSNYGSLRLLPARAPLLQRSHQRQQWAPQFDHPANVSLALQFAASFQRRRLSPHLTHSRGFFVARKR